MKKTVEFYAANIRYTADLLDAVPSVGDKYMGHSWETVETVEEFSCIVPENRTMNGYGYRIETTDPDDGSRYERYCFVPCKYDDDDTDSLWYALMTGPDDDDWGTGTYDREEAIVRLHDKRSDYPDAYIAVIQEGENPTCIDEIR